MYFVCAAEVVDALGHMHAGTHGSIIVVVLTVQECSKKIEPFLLLCCAK